MVIIIYKFKLNTTFIINIIFFIDGKATLLIYDYYLSPTIGRIRVANEIVVPVANQKFEAPCKLR